MKKNDVTVNYAFQEYIPEKKLNERGIKGVSKILTYEEPRWTLKDTASALKIIKEADSALYETIQTYIKEQHLPSENTLQLDFGKSLRYDDEYMGDFSKETLSDKLDNRFIVRYSHDNDEGNLIDGGDEIIINDKELVSLFNGMIEGHVKENIQKYDEYKIKREASQKNEVWIWKDYDDLSGHLVAPDGKSYFSYDWTTKEYKVTPDSTWDSFLDADPTRDTSLTAFKEYAQKFVKENIVRDRAIKIIFEREYIDTEKLLEEEEKEMAKSETLADKYNRMEKLFEDKLSHLGSGDGETFKKLCKWVEEEFPEKDSEGVLLEATSRMIEENLDFGEFNYQAFDDVYGFGDGAEWRFDFSDSAAKELLSGEIVTLSDAQSLIWEKAEKEFAELKNNPQYKDEIEITDRINSAFRIADFLYPEFTKDIDKEKNLPADEWPQYSKEEKKNVINNAFEKIKSAFDEKKVRLSDSITDELVFEGNDKWLFLDDFKALIKGKDAAEHGKESLSYIRPNKEQLHDGIKNGWNFDEITAGYVANPSVENTIRTFTDDIDKMRDFDGLSKEDFLASYDYISEKEYDATAKELKEHGRTGLQTVKALAYKNVMDKNYLAYDNRLEKSGSEADKIQSAIERLTDVSLPAVAGGIGKSEQEVAEIISALLDAKDYVEERFNVVRPTADEIIEKFRDEVSWADILKTELSWKELGLNPEDYDRTESGTKTEKDFKEWAMGLELENTLDLHGFDTALEGVSSWNNSTISEQKWMIIDKLSEEIVSGKLKIENSQDAFDKLLKENEVYKDFVQKGIVKDDTFGLREITEKELKSVSAKEPVDIIKEIAIQKELAEVPELFTREFKNRMKTHFPGPEKDPFIVAKAIINDWKTSKPDYIPALNKWLSDSLKKEGFSTKENLEKGFEKFFKKLSSSEQKRMQHKDSDIGQGR